MAPLPLIVVVLLVVLLIGGLPHYSYSSDWGYGPSGLLGLILVVVLILILTRRL
jgi:hypothetical protein